MAPRWSQQPHRHGSRGCRGLVDPQAVENDVTACALIHRRLGHSPVPFQGESESSTSPPVWPMRTAPPAMRGVPGRAAGPKAPRVPPACVTHAAGRTRGAAHAARWDRSPAGCPGRAACPRLGAPQHHAAPLPVALPLAWRPPPASGQDASDVTRPARPGSAGAPEIRSSRTPHWRTRSTVSCSG